MIKQALKFGLTILGDGTSSEREVVLSEAAIWFTPHAVGDILSVDVDLAKDVPTAAIHLMCSNGGPRPTGEIKDGKLKLSFASKRKIVKDDAGEKWVACADDDEKGEWKPNAPSKDNVFHVTGYFVF